MFFPLFYFINIFLIYIFFFVNSLFERKSVQTLPQMSLRIFKNGNFSFNFKLCGKKKVFWIILFWQGSYRKKSLERGSALNKELGNVLWKTGLDKKRGGKKKIGGFDPQRIYGEWEIIAGSFFSINLLTWLKELVRF